MEEATAIMGLEQEQGRWRFFPSFSIGMRKLLPFRPLLFLRSHFIPSGLWYRFLFLGEADYMRLAP
jgi:hypothetical protein